MTSFEVARRQVERFCDERLPEEMRSEVRLGHEVRGEAITIVEHRAPWTGEGDWTSTQIAQLRHDSRRDAWSLYWMRHTGRWEPCQAAASNDVAPLLGEIDADPDGVFWG